MGYRNFGGRCGQPSMASTCPAFIHKYPRWVSELGSCSVSIIIMVLSFACSKTPDSPPAPTSTSPPSDQSVAAADNPPQPQVATPAPEPKPDSATAEFQQVKVSAPRPKLSTVDVTTELMDPANEEGWDSEVLAESAKTQLKKILYLLKKTQVRQDYLEPYVTQDFTGTWLRVEPHDTTTLDSQYLIRRPQNELSPKKGDTSVVVGAEGLAEALEFVRDALGSGSNIHVGVKLFNVELNQDSFTTRSYVELSNIDPQHSFQLNGLWRTDWRYPDKTKGEDFPRLLWVGVERHDEALHPSGPKQFVDITKAAMKNVAAYPDRVLRGLTHWQSRITQTERMSRVGLHGISVADVNGDELEDVYIPDAGGLPNLLLLRQKDGTLVEAGPKSKVDWLNPTQAALFVDLDNDGDPDLIVAMEHRIVVQENVGDAVFEARAVIDKVASPSSIAAADIDGDGDLDVYVCAYEPVRDRTDSSALPTPQSYRDANNGGRNMLMLNDGNFQFRDGTEEFGLEHNNTRFSFAAAFEDYDNDGDLDLYVANDYGRNNLYRNDNGRFSDVAATAGVEDIAGGMSVSFGDIDGDGWMDLYVGNMFSAAGNRVAFQRRFATGKGDGIVQELQRTARGNSLFRNLGDGTFEDVSLLANANFGRWAWSSRLVDINNDGFRDIVVANGYITNPITHDL